MLQNPFLLAKYPFSSYSQYKIIEFELFSINFTKQDVFKKGNFLLDLKIIGKNDTCTFQILQTQKNKPNAIFKKN